MPFGLCNAPVTFQCVMQSLDFCKVYIDDAIIISWRIKEHQKHLAMVLQRLKEHHLKLHLSNTVFTRALWHSSVRFGTVQHDYSVLYEHVLCHPGLYWPGTFFATVLNGTAQLTTIMWGLKFDHTYQNVS